MGSRSSFAPRCHPPFEPPAFSQGAVGRDAFFKGQCRAEPETDEAGGLDSSSCALCHDSSSRVSDGPAGDGGVIGCSWVQGGRCHHSR